MIKANDTIFQFYLAMMDSMGEYISVKYTERSLKNPLHYQTIIIEKIVRMFHALEFLVNQNQDEGAARCILRGILDSVTTYCFIYERIDKEEMLFRHYLYIFDGFVTYKKCIINGILEKRDEKTFFESHYNEAIGQLKQKLDEHPYSTMNNKSVKTIINNTNWRYESLNNPQSISYQSMYKQIGFDERTAEYYQSYLSQFSHGLCLSNTPPINTEQPKGVLYESIPLADKMIRAIYNTFPKEEMLSHVLQSDALINIINLPDYNFDDLYSFTKALLNNDKTLII